MHGPSAAAPEVRLIELPDELLEARLQPLVDGWNSLTIGELDRTREQPLPAAHGVQSSFREAVCTPFGYEYVEFELVGHAGFRLLCRVEGQPGKLSFQTHHPVVMVVRNAVGAAAWFLQPDVAARG